MSDIISERRLTTLPKTKFSGLDFDNIIQDVTQLVLENPEYNNNWNDFLSSNAGRMLVELFAYISDQLATRVDWMVNENFIGTATQDKSIIRLLKLIGYNLSLPMSAEVLLTVTFDRPVGEYVMSSYDNSEGAGELNIFSINAKGRDGSTSVNFEAIPYDEINRRYLYREGLTIQTGLMQSPNLFHQIKFYEGRSLVETVEVTTDNNFIYFLNQGSVIEDSVDVYLLSGFMGSEEKRLEKVESFLSPRAQRSIDIDEEEIPIPYILNVLEDNRVSIEFGSISLLPSQDRRPLEGNRIRVFYRVGGGENGNIPRRSINASRKLIINNNNANVNFVNETAGFRGEEAENVFQAAALGPLQIRTAQKTVTPDDYNIILNSERGVLISKSYGHSNMPPGVFDFYGMFIKPLEVWNYLVLNKPGWENIPPSKYNEFEWFEQRLQNRFNENYYFRDGTFNHFVQNNTGQIVEQDEIQINETETISAKNFFRINTSPDFKDFIQNQAINNPNFKLSFTYKEINDNFYSLTKNNNYFHPNFELINNGELKEIETTPYLFQQENAYYVSTVDVSGNRNMSDDYNINLSLDNRDAIEINLRTGASDTANVTQSEIINNINTAFAALNDNLVTPEQQGSQTLGLTVADFNAEIVNLLPQKKYYFKVNGIEYFIDTEKNVGGITYNQLIEKMNDALSLKFKANFRNNNNVITITENEENMIFLNKSNIVSAVNNPSILPSSQQPIIINNWLSNIITLGAVANTNLDDEDIKVKIFDVKAAATDIEVENISEEPVGPVWLQRSNREDSEDLFTTIGASLNSFVPSYGSFGRQKLNINGVINETRGFTSFRAAENYTISSTGDYEFRLAVNGLNVNGGSNIIVNLIAGDSLSVVRTKLIASLEDSLSYDGGVLSVGVSGDILIPEISVYNELRIISNLKGENSRVEIIQPVDATSLLTQLQGITEIIGENDAVTQLANGTYSFKLNNYLYSVDIESTDTILDLFNVVGKIGSLLDNDGYTISIEEEEWNDEIEIIFDTADRVDFEDINFFSNLIIKKLEKNVEWEVLDVEWEEFGIPYGGGDYSNIANYFDVTQEEGDVKSFIYLISPCRGERTSVIRFINPSANNATSMVFGLNVADGDRISYGYKRISLVLAEEGFGNFIFENGTLNFKGGTTKQTFYHYIYTDGNMIPIGSYFNTNFNEQDPEYKERALRVFNTVYNLQGEIDYFLSEFEIRITKEKTESPYLFSIQEDWDLDYGVPAQIESVDNPHTLLNTNNYQLIINIDGLKYIIVDVTGDLGVSGTYSLGGIVQNINNALRSQLNTGIYTNFNFCIIENNKLVLRSPLRSIESLVSLRKIKGSTINATEVIFKVEENKNFDEFEEYTEEGDDYKEYKINPTGDYFITENKVKITGDFEFGEEYITNISNEDMEKIEVGYKVYRIQSVLNPSYILEKGENKIKVSNVIVSNPSQFEVDFYISDSSLELFKVKESNWPDSDFYIHFINDRRVVENVFDGRLIIDDETGNVVKTPGYEVGSLDEDFYEDFLQDKKIVGIDNVFRQPMFKTFSIVGTVYFESIYSREDVRNRVEQSIRREFGLRSRDFAQPLSKSRVMNIIHENEGVNYVEIDYFGENPQDVSTNVINTIKPRFNEIMVLSENITSGGRTTRGIIFNYVSSSGV